MFKENKETPMVVLIVLFIVFSVLPWFRILPGSLAESGMSAKMATLSIMFSFRDRKVGKTVMSYLEIIIAAALYVVAVKSLLLTFNM